MERTTTGAKLAALAIATVMLGACHSDPPPSAAGSTGIDFTAIDAQVDPCTDFYHFACGGWISAHPLHADGSSIGRGSQAFYDMVPILRGIISDDARDIRLADDPQGAYVGQHYRNCMAAPGDTSAQALLQPHLDEIDAIASLDDLAAVVAHQRQIGSHTFFYMFVTIDPMDATRHLVAADQGGLELPDRSYYLDDDQQPVRDQYREHITRLSGLFGAPVDADAVLRVEHALAAAERSSDDRRDPTTDYHLMSADALIALAPHFPWQRFLDAGGFPAFSSVDVIEPDFFRALDSLVTTAPLADLKHYLRWQLIDDKSSYLDSAPVDEQFRFHQQELLGVSQASPRDWTCYLSTLSIFGFPLSRPYVARNFGPDQRAAVRTVIDQLHAALVQRVSAVDWLDDPTRAAALAKLQALVPKVGYPDQWPDLNGLASDAPSYMAENLALAAYNVARSFQSLDQPVDRNLWYMTPIEVNAYYSQEENAIVFPAGILRAPFFLSGASRAGNLGALGAIAGHELTHALDDEGRHYDGAGSLHDWWSPGAAGLFETRAQCLVDAAEHFQALPGMNVDGTLTLGENIADLGGLKLAYDVLTSAHDPEPARHGFDERQQFFLSYAQNWCQNQRDETTAQALRTDPHAPVQYRVNGVVAQVPAFAQAFHCPATAPLVRPQPCDVW
jgi:endothelin-converting enzyme/putative endopeptidase